MPVQADNLIKEICSRLTAGGLTSLQTCQLQNASTIINNNKVFSVESCSNLPLACDNEGRLVYIRNIGAYRFSNGSTWESCLGSEVTKICNIILTWGCNTPGIIGDGTIQNRCSPVREFCSATDWCFVNSGGEHVVAIKTNGQLWTWGSNANGALGIGNTINHCTPVREFCSATDWCQASAGTGGHTAAIKTSGQLWLWGTNSNGALGIGSSATIGRCSPVREFCSATDWCQVSAAGFLTTALKTTGELWTWGTNNVGQLGIGSSATIARCSPVREFCSATDWCQVCNGAGQIAALKTSGQLWTWGSNSNGSLGIGSSATIGRCSPVREFCSATDWCQVSASAFYSMSAVKTSGQLWGWGCNGNFGIGDGTSTTRSSPVREFTSSTDWCCISRGSFSSFGLKNTGNLWVWGSNVSGELGLGDIIIRSFPTIGGCSLGDWVNVSARRGSAIGLLKISRGFCL